MTQHLHPHHGHAHHGHETTPVLDSPAEQFYEAETGSEPDARLAVDVRVVETAHVQTLPPRSILTDQVPVLFGAGPVRVVTELRTRHTMILTARGGDVYLGQAFMASAATGYLLKADTSITVTATDAVWATAATTNAVVHVFAEIREG